MVGIVSFGAYLPRRRLQRLSVFAGIGWHSPAIMMMASGERAMCNWDEDVLTMAVAAARDCLDGQDRQGVDAVYLAGTTLPFADRQNAGIVAAALNLPEEGLATVDCTGAQKAGTGALLAALYATQGGGRQRALVVAGDHRRTKAGSFYELWFGDGAAALLVGSGQVVAEFLGAHTVACDFVPHYRGAEHRFDYTWEERWMRDEGYAKIIPQTIGGLLKNLGLAVTDIARFAYPCFITAEHRAIAKKMGLAREQAVDNLHEQVGEVGAAHPLVLLISALEKAKPGDRLVVAGFGQGCDALCFRVTDAITQLPARRGVVGHLALRTPEESYTKFLSFNNLLDTEEGIRAEAPTQTAMTVLWRKRRMILGLVGGRCTKCGTPQFPKMDVCVNPACNAVHALEDYEFADRPAFIKAFTGDLLSVSPEPPAIYGMVQFVDGGRLMADFTDCELHKLKVGQPVQMVFRKRMHDAGRGFTGYFWKAVPRSDAPKGGA